MISLQNSRKLTATAWLAVLNALLIAIGSLTITAQPQQQPNDDMQSSGIVPDVVDALGNDTVQVRVRNSFFVYLNQIATFKRHA